MTKTTRMLAITAGLVVLALGVWLLPVGAEEEEHGDPHAALLAKHLGAAKISMVKAVSVAGAEVTGTPFAARFELDDGVPMYEVFVLTGGAAPKIVEVEVHAVTGAVLDDSESEDDAASGDDDDDSDGDDAASGDDDDGSDGDDADSGDDDDSDEDDADSGDDDGSDEDDK